MKGRPYERKNFIISITKIVIITEIDAKDVPGITPYRHIKSVNITIRGALIKR